MNKEILNEINRFREIAGLTLLNEASIGGGWIDELLTALGKTSDELDTFIKNSDDVLATEIRTNIDDVASRLKTTSDVLLEKIRLKDLTTNEADELLKTLLKSTDTKVKDTLANYYINNRADLMEIVDEMTNSEFVELLKTSQLPYDELNTSYKKIRESFVTTLSNELPEIQENLLKRFDNAVKPLLADIATRSATSTTKKVTLSTIRETTNNIVNSIRPKTYAEQFDDVLNLIKKERLATKKTPLTESQIDAVETFITELLGKETGTVQEVLLATQKKIDELINIAKTGDAAATKESKKQLRKIWNGFSCKGEDGKFLGYKGCLFSLSSDAIGVALIGFLLYLVFEYEVYTDKERETETQKILSKIGNCITKDDIVIDIEWYGFDWGIENAENWNGKELGLMVRNKEGQTIVKNIKWDSGKKVFVDSIDENKIIQCAGGSGTSEEYTLGAGGNNSGTGNATVGEAKAFLTDPSVGFVLPISFDGETTLFDQDTDTLADGTYTFTDSTTVESGGPLTGKIKITGKKIEFISA